MAHASSHTMYVGLGRKKNEPTCSTWMAMISRCTVPSNTSYPNYGARGISVCERWMEPYGNGFWNFLEDMGEKPEGMTLDRKDPNKDYSPENCRWATYFEQSLSKRLQKNNTSGCRGVYWIAAKKKWRVEIKKEQKRYHIGYFLSFDDAVKARKEAELLYFGKEVEYFGKA